MLEEKTVMAGLGEYQPWRLFTWFFIFELWIHADEGVQPGSVFLQTLENKFVRDGLQNLGVKFLQLAQLVVVGGRYLYKKH